MRLQFTSPSRGARRATLAVLVAGALVAAPFAPGGIQKALAWSPPCNKPGYGNYNNLAWNPLTFVDFDGKNKTYGYVVLCGVAGTRYNYRYGEWITTDVAYYNPTGTMIIAAFDDKGNPCDAPAVYVPINSTGYTDVCIGEGLTGRASYSINYLGTYYQVGAPTSGRLTPVG
jgi:hypothetical protein